MSVHPVSKQYNKYIFGKNVSTKYCFILYKTYIFPYGDALWQSFKWDKLHIIKPSLQYRTSSGINLFKVLKSLIQLTGDTDWLLVPQYIQKFCRFFLGRGGNKEWIDIALLVWFKVIKTHIFTHFVSIAVIYAGLMYSLRR